MTVSLKTRIYCMLDDCELEAPDFGSLIGHIAMAHPDLPSSIEIRPRGRRRRTVLAPDTVIPITDYLTEQTIQELESLTSQADTHVHEAIRDAEQVRETARLSALAMHQVKERVLALHHRIMELRPASRQTRRVTEANLVSPPVVIEEEDEPAPAPRASTPPVQGAARRFSRPGEGIVVQPMPAALPIDDGGGPISNESLMRELHQGKSGETGY